MVDQIIEMIDKNRNTKSPIPVSACTQFVGITKTKIDARIAPITEEIVILLLDETEHTSLCEQSHPWLNKLHTNKNG
jgi:hypothetical protein